jgi:hypothetical protein
MPEIEYIVGVPALMQTCSNQLHPSVTITGKRKSECMCPQAGINGEYAVFSHTTEGNVENVTWYTTWSRARYVDLMEKKNRRMEQIT